MGGGSQKRELSDDMQSRVLQVGKRNLMSEVNRENISVVTGAHLADQRHHQASWAGKGRGPSWFCVCPVTCIRSTNNQALIIPNQRNVRLQDLLFQGPQGPIFGALGYRSPNFSMLCSSIAMGFKSSFPEKGLKVQRVGGHQVREEVMEGS